MFCRGGLFCAVYVCRYHSSDSFDLGEALWLSQWGLHKGEEWARLVTRRSVARLEELWEEGYFKGPPKFRLAFREFGTTLGVQVNPHACMEWQERVSVLHSFWSANTLLFARDSDITPVMCCASLIPGVWQRDNPIQEKTASLQV